MTTTISSAAFSLGYLNGPPLGCALDCWKGLCSWSGAKTGKQNGNPQLMKPKTVLDTFSFIFSFNPPNYTAYKVYGCIRAE